MKQVMVIVLILAAVAFGGKWAWDKYGGGVTEEGISQRVTTVLQNMQAGGDEATATCVWATGAARINDAGALSAAVDGFERWRKDGGLTGAVRSFSVDEVDITGAVPIAYVTINGSDFELEVPKGERIAWSE